jgi:Cu-Zn family superoxide dismutase
MKQRLLALILTSASVLTLAACAGTPLADETSVAATPAKLDAGPTKLEAKLEARSKSKVTGTVTLEPAADMTDMTLVKYEITGLKKNGKHGFHIHEKGDCSAPDAITAGGHWNPTGTKHGDLHAAERHLGDFGNVTANAKGVAKGEIKVPTFSLSAAKGLAVIVHAKADDKKTQPSGNAGDRIGCGVLQ